MKQVERTIDPVGQAESQLIFKHNADKLFLAYLS